MVVCGTSTKLQAIHNVSFVWNSLTLKISAGEATQIHHFGSKCIFNGSPELMKFQKELVSAATKGCSYGSHICRCSLWSVQHLAWIGRGHWWFLEHDLVEGAAWSLEMQGGENHIGYGEEYDKTASEKLPLIDLHPWLGNTLSETPQKKYMRYLLTLRCSCVSNVADDQCWMILPAPNWFLRVRYW